MRTSSWRRPIAAAIAAASLAVLGGCGSDASGSSTRTPTAVVTPKPGSTVGAVVGRTLVVKLEANPTTGYDWTVKQAPPSIALLKSTYREPTGDRLGASGQQLLTFKATAAGTWQMELIYDRPSAPTQPAKSLSFSVHATTS